MNFALFGATGRTGGLILKLALSGGHQVTALVRDPCKLTESQSGLRIVQGALVRRVLWQRPAIRKPLR